MNLSYRHIRWSRRAGAMRVPVTAMLVLATVLLAPRVVLAQERLSQPQYSIITEKDVKIPMRDGDYLVADVFRPNSSEKFPVIMSFSIYQKDLDIYLYNPKTQGFYPGYGHREVPHYQWWVPRGYVIIRVDARGTGKSAGNFDHWSIQEARDYYDSIEWAAVQRWSTGKVGLAGVSNYGINQWIVASLQPPHLAAIIPWEGFSDMYREAMYQGGIWNIGFYGAGWGVHIIGRQLLEFTRANNPTAYNENYPYNMLIHHLDGPWWDQVKARGQFDKITVPVYSSGNWGGWGLHLRGNTEGYIRSASKQKKLEMHVGSHTGAFYSDEGLTTQLRWYDYWLKGKNTGIMNEPPVKLCIRTSLTECTWRYENEFPIARAQYTKFYLSAQKANAVKDSLNDGLLTKTTPTTEGVITYSAVGKKMDLDEIAKEQGYITATAEPGESVWRAQTGRPLINFTTEPLTEDTEVTGHVNLVMWVSSTTDDMDIFAYLQSQKPDGTTSGRLARGQLKVSHRKLDPKLSTPYRPYHTHDQEQKLRTGEVVEVQVEIWPTSMVFRKGDRIRLDLYSFSPSHYWPNYGKGDNSIYTGGSRASYLLLPVIPPGGQPVGKSGGSR